MVWTELICRPKLTSSSTINAQRRILTRPRANSISSQHQSVAAALTHLPGHFEAFLAAPATGGWALPLEKHLKTCAARPCVQRL